MGTSLKSVFSNYLNDPGVFLGIADALAGVTTGFNIDQPLMYNVEYIGRHSGGKVISPILEDYILEYGSTLPLKSDSTAVLALAEVIVNLYKDEWFREYEAMVAEYNPIENYNRNEEGLDVVTDQQTVEQTDVYGKNTTLTKEMSQDETALTAYGKKDTINTTDTKGTSVSQLTTNDFGKVETTEVDGTDTGAVAPFSAPSTFYDTDKKTSDTTNIS